MSGFSSELFNLAAALDVPQPMRARIILELDTDLRDLEQTLLESGVSPEEAHQRSVTMLMPESEALAGLARCHRSMYLRLLDRFSDPVRHLFERVMFSIAVATLFVLGLVSLAELNLFSDPAPLVVPLLWISLVVIGVGLWKLFQLYVRMDHRLAQLRSGLTWLPLAAVSAIVLSLGGIAVDLYAVAGTMTATDEPAATIISWLRRDMAAVSLGLIIASLSLSLWLWLSAGIARVAQAEAESLLRTNPEYAGGRR